MKNERFADYSWLLLLLHHCYLANCSMLVRTLAMDPTMLRCLFKPVRQ
jgi:hypothetical protein